MNLYCLTVAALTAIFLHSGAAHAEAISLDNIKTYERDVYDRSITKCDRLAGHPNDPEGVTEGVARSAMDKPAAIKACLAAVKKDPENPRLNYQLARAYGYSGLHEESDPYRIAALKTGYPQSLFVVGYIRLEGWDGREADACYGGELIRRSAHAGRYSGLLGFPHYALAGRFKDCIDFPAIDRDEMHKFIENAKAGEPNYYQRLLIEYLETELTKDTPTDNQ